jgi:hypothetical protein
MSRSDYGGVSKLRSSCSHPSYVGLNEQLAVNLLPAGTSTCQGTAKESDYAVGVGKLPSHLCGRDSPGNASQNQARRPAIFAIGT